MNLYEFEGKNLFKKYDISVPEGVVFSRESLDVLSWETFPCVLKAQVQNGKRKKNGGILFIKDKDELFLHASSLFEKKICNDDVLYVLVEEKKDIQCEYYLAITYDTIQKVPVILFSSFGGVDVEDQENIVKYFIDPLVGFQEEEMRRILSSSISRLKDIDTIVQYAEKLFLLFQKEDAFLAEINPLARLSDGSLMALDAKVILDNTAAFRHEWNALPERTYMGRLLTERERMAQSIDAGEFYYRGTAGKYTDLDGDIACLFSGGGASVSMMDALISVGGRPANYTEYSGNPPREKVRELSNIVFSKPGLKGIWIVGGVANFTHIGETMAGIADALKIVKPSIPIVIRRAGPYEEEGKKLMEDIAKEYNLNITWYGRDVAMTDTAEILLKKIYEYSH